MDVAKDLFRNWSRCLDAACMPKTFSVGINRRWLTDSRTVPDLRNAEFFAMSRKPSQLLCHMVNMHAPRAIRQIRLMWSQKIYRELLSLLLGTLAAI